MILQRDRGGKRTYLGVGCLVGAARIMASTNLASQNPPGSPKQAKAPHQKQGSPSKSTEDYPAAILGLQKKLREEIPSLRRAAYAVVAYYAGENVKGAHEATRTGSAVSDRAPVRGSASLDQWVKEVDDWADTLKQVLEDAAIKLDSSPDNVNRFVLRATRVAESLSEATQSLLSDAVRSPDPGSGAGSSGATLNVDSTTELAAYAWVTTAMDHVAAAEGALERVRRSIATREISGLVGSLVVVLFAYTAFHPSWGWLSLLWGRWWILPTNAAPVWEVICWSFFGAVASSYLRVAQDTVDNTFDARDPFKYVYRIVTAPLVAIVLVFFWSISGFALSTGGTSAPLFGGTSTLSTLTLIVVSFLLGFFSREAQDLLSSVWKRVTSSGSGSTNTPAEQGKH